MQGARAYATQPPDVPSLLPGRLPRNFVQDLGFLFNWLPLVIYRVQIVVSLLRFRWSFRELKGFASNRTTITWRTSPIDMTSYTNEFQRCFINFIFSLPGEQLQYHQSMCPLTGYPRLSPPFASYSQPVLFPSQCPRPHFPQCLGLDDNL